MASTAKLAALAVAATLLAQPLLAALACWTGPVSAAACPCNRPMSHETAPTAPAKARPADPGCCETSSSESAPWAALAKGTETTRVQPVVAAMPDQIGFEMTAAPVMADSAPPRGPAHSLLTLYCTFLI